MVIVTTGVHGVNVCDVGPRLDREVPGPAEEKLGPHIRRTAATLWYLYAGLTTADLR